MNNLLSLDPARAPAWLAARDPRLRVLCALALAAVAVSLQRFTALALTLGLALALALLARLPLGLLGRRLLAFEGFMLILLLMLPFSTPGTPLWQGFGLTASSEGLERAVAIVLRANSVVIGLLALLGTLAPEQLGHALGKLRLPDKLVHLFLFTGRYLFVLLDEYRRLRQAMRARAFVARSDRHTWRSFGWLVGMLLVRSLERSQRIVAAMRCRGFHGRFYLLDPQRWQAADSALLGLFLLLLTAPLTLEWWPETAL